MLTVKSVNKATAINMADLVTATAQGGKVQTNRSSRTSQEVIWAQQDYKSVHFYKPSYMRLIEKPSINSMRQNNSCTGISKLRLRNSQHHHIMISRHTHISVRSLIRTRTRKGNKFMAPLVNHKTANWWREKKIYN